MKRSRISINFKSTTRPVEYKRRIISVVKSSCKSYFNAQHLLITLGAEERSFLDYLCEKMDSINNRLTVNREFKNIYKVHISSLTSNRSCPSEGSLSQYVSNFKKLGLILPEGNMGTGYYSVNPKYFYKGSETKRLELIKYMIESRIKNGIPLFGLISTTEEEFFGIE